MIYSRQEVTATLNVTVTLGQFTEILPFGHFKIYLGRHLLFILNAGAIWRLSQSKKCQFVTALSIAIINPQIS